MELYFYPSLFLLKRLIIFLLFISTLSLLAQNGQENLDFCGIVIGPEEYKLDRFFGDNQKLVDLLIQNNVNIDKNYLDQLDRMESMPLMKPELFKNTSTYYEIPIKAWIYRNNNGTGNISTSQVYQVVDELNSIYNSKTNIRFYLLCDISVINNSNYTNYGDQYFSTYTANNRVTGAINVHFVYSSAPPPNEKWGGLAYMPWGDTPFSCAVQTIGFSTFTVGNTLSHEIGHNLGLRHTHDNPRQPNNNGYNESAGNCYQEAVSRSKRQGLFCVSTIDELKCEINGDGLCDTPADPGIYKKNRNPKYYLEPNSCTYDPSAGGQDNWGDTWIPNTSNIMSYSPYYCRNFFSPLQVAKMYGYIGDIGISYPALNISGPNSLCSGNIATYSVPYQSGVTFLWEMPYNMNLLDGQGTNAVLVESAGNYGGIMEVTPSCGNRTAKKTILNIQDPPIEGYDQACPLYTYTYSTPYIGNADYEWSVTNGYIVSGQYTNQVQIALTQSPSQQTIIDLELTNVCDSSLFGQKIVTHGDPPFPAQQCFSHQDKNGKSLENQVSFISDKDILLYPNPASTAINILIPNEERYSVSLLDMAGRELFENNKGFQRNFTLDVQSYPDGVYVIYLVGKQQTFSKRLILKR